MIIGHIGVRKGSKGVPGKNFRPICGRPLIDWTLDQLLAAPEVDVVVVSTDDEGIHAHALARGALDIGLRPAELATDTAPKWAVWQHALAETEKRTAPARAFLDLDATSPLRDQSDITEALALFERERPDMVMSCCPARKSPYSGLFETDSSGALHVSKPLPAAGTGVHPDPTVYEHAASTYVVAPDYLRSASSLFEGRVIPYLMPAERCVDIDSPLDFEIVEFLLREKEHARSA